MVKTPPNTYIYLLSLLLAAVLWATPAVAQVGQDYVVGTGDSLNIQVYGEPELSFASRPILDEGIVVMPLIGEIVTTGKSVRNIESEITQKLANGYLVNPRVSVSVAEYRPFFLVGEIRNPGTLKYVTDMTVRKAIVLGGGLTADGDESKISIERADGARLRDVSDSTPVYPGDIVTVGARDRFSVRGAIQYPGELSFQSGMTLENAVALAGGFTADADRTDITLERRGQVLDVGGRLDIGLEPNDILTVNRLSRQDARETSYIFIKGEVQRGGRYEYEPGMTVEKAIVVAGGFSDRASRRKIDIRREGEPPVSMSRVDLTERVLPGDVITVGTSLF